MSATVVEKVKEVITTARELATGSGKAAPVRGGGHEHKTVDAPIPSGRKVGRRG